MTRRETVGEGGDYGEDGGGADHREQHRGTSEEERRGPPERWGGQHRRSPKRESGRASNLSLFRRAATEGAMSEGVASREMIRLAVLALFAVELGAGFGTATATVVSTTQESMIVEFHVEVGVSADSVVVHLALPGEDPVTIPMVERQTGSYGVTTEVRTADYQVVFEALGEPGAQSDPTSLTELGVDLDTGSDVAESTESAESSPGTQRWLWLGIALAAASLSALAFWVLGERDMPDHEDADPDDDEASPAPEEDITAT